MFSHLTISPSHHLITSPPHHLLIILKYNLDLLGLLPNFEDQTKVI
jgi:hypothetical protein